jgi:hypothetical protein
MRVVMAGVVTSFALLILPLMSSADPTQELITFKGIPLDTPGARAQVHAMCMRDDPPPLPSYAPCEPTAYGRILVFTTSYGSLESQPVTVEYSSDGSVLEVKLDGYRPAYTALVDPLTQKYGMPAKLTTEVRNGVGAVFENTIYVWEDRQGARIVLESMHERVDKSLLLIQSAAKVRALAASDASRVNAAKENL